MADRDPYADYEMLEELGSQCVRTRAISKTEQMFRWELWNRLQSS